MFEILAAATQPSSPAEDSYNFYSITGVVGVTFIVVEILKKLIGPATPWLGKVPVILFPLGIAPILALLANKVMMQDDGTPFLSGNIWTVLGRAILGAASTSGVYTWLRQPGATIGNAQPLIGKADTGEDNVMKPNYMILLIGSMLFTLIGCQGATNPEKVILRDAMDNGTRQIRENEKTWASKLVAYPLGQTDPRTGLPSDGKNQAATIVPLTPAQYNNDVKAHKEYEDLVNEDKAKDNQPLIQP